MGKRRLRREHRNNRSGHYRKLHVSASDQVPPSTRLLQENGGRISARLCQTSKQFQYLLLQKSHQTRSERQRANGSSRFITILIAAAKREREGEGPLEKRGAMQKRRGEEVIDPNSFRAPTGNSGGGTEGGGNQAKTILRRKPTAEIQSAAAAVFYTVANVKNLAGIRAGEAIGRRDKCPAPIGPADADLPGFGCGRARVAHPDLPVRMKRREAAAESSSNCSSSGG